jgi:hypothetical protein
MNSRGVALIVSFMVITVLTILSAALISRSVSESNIVRRYAESTQAFWLAEAGVNRALKELRDGYSCNTSQTDLWHTALGQGGYYVNIEPEGSNCKVTAYGSIPLTGTVQAERIIEVEISNVIPPNFYDNAIYSAGDAEFKGNAYSITGNVRYADEIRYSQNNVNGTITQDASINPLANLNYQKLLSISQSQGNVYDEDRLEDVQEDEDSFPSSFWYSEGVPNVVYVTTDLALNGNIGTIGGFFVVVGDVITDPDDTQEARINGNGEVEGVIYTRDEFEIKGGGGGLNVYGGVFAGDEAELDGNARVAYNSDYMSAISALNINEQIQIVAWKEVQNPYSLSP